MSIDEILLYIKAQGVENEDNLMDIAWKYSIGNAILSIVDQQGLKIGPNSLLDKFGNEIIIAEKVLIHVSKTQSDEVISEGESSESQLNPREDLG
jgi:hypothetical protein